MKMTPQQFKEKQKALGLNNSQMAKLLGVHRITVFRYRSGRTGVPIMAAKLLEQTKRRRNTKMSPQQFKKKQKALGLNNRQMAERLDVSEATVSNYRTGRSGVPIKFTKSLVRAKDKKQDNIKMTPQEFKEIQKALGWDGMQMAKYLGVSRATVSCWRTGKIGIRKIVIRLLEQANKHNKTKPK